MCSVSKWLAIVFNLWWITMWGMCMVAHSASLLFFNWPLLLDFTRQLHFISISLIRISIVNHIRYGLIWPENFRRKNVHLKINHVNFIHFLVTLPALGWCCFHWSTLFGTIEASYNRPMTLGWGRNVYITWPQALMERFKNESARMLCFCFNRSSWFAFSTTDIQSDLGLGLEVRCPELGNCVLIKKCQNEYYGFSLQQPSASSP